MSRLSMFFILLFALMTSAVAAQGEIGMAFPSSTSTMRVDAPGYTVMPSLTGATGSRVFSLEAGTLPPGVALNVSTGSVAGTPTAIGEFHGIVIGVRDASGGQGLSPILSIEVIPLPGASYLDRILQVDGRVSLSPVVESVFGAPRFTLAAGSVLPRGLTLNRNTGIISGVPTVPGVSTGLRVTIIDSDGTGSTSEPFSLEVSTASVSATVPAPSLATDTPPPPKIFMRVVLP